MGTAAASDAGKVGLLEMILYAETESERIDTWERVLHSEGEALDPSIARRRLVFRKMARTLELLQQHELDFVKMINARREAAARERARSTERSSDQSMNGN